MKNLDPIMVAFLVMVATLLASPLWAAQGPNRPQPQAVALDSKTTAILVLDLNQRCENPKQRCSQLMPAPGDFLEKARTSSVPILYTVSGSQKGKPSGEIAAPLKRRPEEPVVYPDAFDKFHGGELQELLQKRGAKTLVHRFINSATKIPPDLPLAKGGEPLFGKEGQGRFENTLP